MTIPVIAGCIIDKSGYEIEVWLSPCERADSGYDHVTLICGGGQIGDFAFNTPRQDDPLEVAAAEVVTTYVLTQIKARLHLLENDDDDESVIDDDLPRYQWPQGGTIH